MSVKHMTGQLFSLKNLKFFDFRLACSLAFRLSILGNSYFETNA